MNIYVDAIASVIMVALLAVFLFKFAGPALTDLAKLHAEQKESQAKANQAFNQFIIEATPAKDLPELQDTLVYIVAHGYTPDQLRSIINRASKEEQ